MDTIGLLSHILDHMNSIKIIVKIDNRLTKVRSRQAVKLPAVQPVVMTTGTLACLFLGRK